VQLAFAANWKVVGPKEVPLVCRLLAPKSGEAGQFEERFFGLANATPLGRSVRLPMTPSVALLGLVTVTVTVVFPPGWIFGELSAELTEAPVNAKAGAERECQESCARGRFHFRLGTCQQR